MNEKLRFLGLDVHAETKVCLVLGNDEANLIGWAVDSFPCQK